MFGFFKNSRENRIKKNSTIIRNLKELEYLSTILSLKSYLIDEEKDGFIDTYNLIRINDTIPMCSKDDEYGIDLLKFVSVEDILTILKDYEKRFDKEIKYENGLKILKMLEPTKSCFKLIEYWVKLDVISHQKYYNDYDYEPKELEEIRSSLNLSSVKNRKMNLTSLNGVVDRVVYDLMKEIYLISYKLINYGRLYSFKKEPNYLIKNRLTIDEIVEGKKYVDYEIKKMIL